MPVQGNRCDVLHIRTDANRDGLLDERDDDVIATTGGRFDWEKGGAFLLANIDDDDGNGIPDAQDDVINGAGDLPDISAVEISLPGCAVEGMEFQAVLSGPKPSLVAPSSLVSLFTCLDHSCRAQDSFSSLALEPGGHLLIGLEAKRFAGPDWNGIVTLSFQPSDRKATRRLHSPKVQLRVAPWLALPDSAEVDTLYVGSGVYPNQALLDGLEKLAPRAQVTLDVRPARKWQQMWLQDTFEMGVTSLPGREPMHVVLNGVRGAGLDLTGARLLAPDMGFIQIGEPRGLKGSDSWADWMGNLSVTPPIEGYPYGRIYYGYNSVTGIAFHPDVVSFLEAQEMQNPFWLDTAFLEIKHVDEVASFVEGAQGEYYALVASPQAALSPLGMQELDRSNAFAQNIMDDNIERIIQATQIDDGQILKLPILYDGDGKAVWSSPINALSLNAFLVMGQTDVPDAIRTSIQERLSGLVPQLEWIDDRAYQERSGNVHCATNTRRKPPFVMHSPIE